MNHTQIFEHCKDLIIIRKLEKMKQARGLISAHGPVGSTGACGPWPRGPATLGTRAAHGTGTGARAAWRHSAAPVTWPYRCREKAAGDGEPHRRAISTGESGAVATHMLLGRR
jgi:hypothetical protein